MRYSAKHIYILALIIPAVFAFGIVPASSSEAFHNGHYGYELELSPDWQLDTSGYPDILVCSLGKGGRFIIEIIPEPDEQTEKPVPDEVAAGVVASLKSNFADFSVRNEGWSRTAGGLNSYDISFECYVGNELAIGKAKVVFGDVAITLVYYDDKLDFEYYLPNVQAAFDGLTIDKALIERGPATENTTQGKPVDFIDPLKCVYRNETFGYMCENPGRLTPKEVGGPGLVVFPTGAGEAAIRYLSAYQDAGKEPQVFIKEMFDEIFASFSRYETITEEAVKLDDGRAGYLLEVNAVFNGADWKGLFVGFISDDKEPFLLSLLGPTDEYESNKAAFTTLWRSFSFDNASTGK